MQQWYQCPRCGKDILYGVNPCPYCKCSLAWSQQGPVQYLPPAAQSEQAYQPQQTPQDQQQYKAEPPKTKHTLTQKITAVAILVVLGIFGTCAVCICTQPSKTPTSTPTQTTQPPIQQPVYSGPEVEYEITGSAQSVSVTLENATGGTEQESDVYLPHTYSYDSFPNYFLYISAQNNGETGSVTVTIRVNGQVVKTSTSTGAYVIASASASK